MPSPWTWKLSRELRRLGTKVLAIMSAPANRSQTRIYENARASKVNITKTSHAFGKSVAVLVLYQPGGLAQSVYSTCAHLRSVGYSILVVSNAPLSGSDRDHLAAYASAILERPNIGYDFGAYRDAVFYLIDQRIDLENLVLMNDSIWFPLFSDCELIDRLRGLNADFAGPVYYRHSRKSDKDYIQSYIMYFRGALLADHRFARFWRDFELSNDKSVVVRRGERGLSQFMRAEGYSVDALFSRETLRAAYVDLSDAELEQVLAYERHLNPRAATRVSKLLALDRVQGWRERALRFVSGPDWTNFVPTGHPIVTVGHLAVPFAKKDRNHNYRAWRAEFLKLCDAKKMDGLDAAIVAEIQDWDK